MLHPKELAIRESQRQLRLNAHVATSLSTFDSSDAAEIHRADCVEFSVPDFVLDQVH